MGQYKNGIVQHANESSLSRESNVHQDATTRKLEN